MVSAILLSGGIGSRMKSSIPKQYLPLRGIPLALHSYQFLKQHPFIEEIIVVCDPLYHSHFPNAIYALPGSRRQDSLLNGLEMVSESGDYILIHDAARPFLQTEEITEVIKAGIQYGAASLATPVKTTIKSGDENLFVTQTLKRSSLYNIQTPQIVKKEILLKGFAKANEQKLTVTDDVSLAELIDSPVKLVIGSEKNIKLTTPQDFQLAEILFENANCKI